MWRMFTCSCWELWCSLLFPDVSGIFEVSLTRVERLKGPIWSDCPVPEASTDPVIKTCPYFHMGGFRADFNIAGTVMLRYVAKAFAFTHSEHVYRRAGAVKLNAKTLAVRVETRDWLWLSLVVVKFVRDQRPDKSGR